MSEWVVQTYTNEINMSSVTYGNGLFVAVAYSGTGNRVMTSLDGITWTQQTTPANNNWYGVTYGNGLFVAVAGSGTGNRVMTSPDGITWTSRTSAADNSWYGVTYGNGLFVAVAASGTGNRVMTSPDGITWTSRTSAADNSWYGVTYGNGLFVAVAGSGTGNRVMTSPDGITWTSRTSAADNNWYGVTYGNGLFVAVAGSGQKNRVMTSPDGITWTSRTSAADNNWYGVTYGNGLFVAVAGSGTGNRVMTSNGKLLPTLGSFTIPTKTFGDAAFTLTAPSSNSDGGFTYSSSNTSIASISGTQVTMLDSGSVTITATQAATSNYLSGTTTATLTISKATPTITNFTIPRKIYGSAPFTLPTPSSNSTGLFSYESSDQTIATIAGDSLTILKFGSVIITATQAETSKYLSGTISFVFNISNICFPAGTPIVTDQGLIHIEKINPDIHTIRNKKIVGITKIYSIDKYLVCFEKDALGQNIPNQKTIITKNHRILYKGKMIQAKEFIDKFDNVYKIKYKGEMLYNVLMEKHDKMIVNNLICETLHPENSIAKLYMILKKLVDEKENKIINTENDSSVKNKIHNCRK